MTTTQDILGPGYTARTLGLRDGSTATLVHRAAERNTRGAVLYVHGFVDYFFQTHLAEFFTDRGWDFYALDLRRYGRSIREDDIPWFTADLAEYHEELDMAVGLIRGDGHSRLIAMGHSTGGLIVPMWAYASQGEQVLDGIILNSPWLDLQEPWIVRTAGTWIIRGIGRMRPRAVIPQGLGGVYPQSIHKAAHGEWDFNTDWKPLTPQPVRFGFLAAVRRAHAELHRGLDLRLPILMMHSDKSLLGVTEWSPEVMMADTVLDVAQMDQWAPKLGSNLTTVAIPDGVHDLVLSSPPVRTRVFAEMEAWLDCRFS
jgi:alpha-beta hydrolase superfamily lysophospholipase